MQSSMNKSMVVIVCVVFCFLVAGYAQQPVTQSDAAQGVALRKALEQQARTINLEFSRNEEWRDDRLSTLKKLLGDQLEGETKLLHTATDLQALEKGRMGLEKLRVRADCVEQNTKLVDGHSVLTKSDLRMERAKILFKPEPTYTNEARQANASGTVLLKAMFTAEGSVRYIEPIRSVQYGLTEQAIKAANAIKFKPESICGKPVNSWIQLEYLFSYGWGRTRMGASSETMAVVNTQ